MYRHVSNSYIFKRLWPKFQNKKKYFKYPPPKKKIRYATQDIYFLTQNISQTFVGKMNKMGLLAVGITQGGGHI